MFTYTGRPQSTVGMNPSRVTSWQQPTSSLQTYKQQNDYLSANNKINRPCRMQYPTRHIRSQVFTGNCMHWYRQTTSTTKRKWHKTWCSFMGEPSISMPPPEKYIWSCWDVTSDLVASKCNQFIFVPTCTEVVNLVKFPEWFTRLCVNKLSIYDHARMHRWKARKQNASCS